MLSRKLLVLASVSLAKVMSDYGFKICIIVGPSLITILTGEILDLD